MQANPLLSIVIPTYNRAHFLDYCLEVHIPLAREHNVQIIISDNASPDSTAEVVKKRIKEYPLIQYHRNEINVVQKNFELALKYPRTDYVWLLGDTYQIPPDGIDYVLKRIASNKEKFDVIVFNQARRVVDIPQQDYSDQNKLLSDLGWHMTCLAVLIYSSKLIATADFERYRNTYFTQTAVIFEQIANREFLVHWDASRSVQPISNASLQKKNWLDQTFEIWIENWTNFIFSLPPSYNLAAKMKCIKNHGIKSGVFNLKGLLILRGFNILNYKKYRQYSHLFSLTISSYSNIMMFLISLLPQILPQSLDKIYKAIKKISQQDQYKT